MAENEIKEMLKDIIDNGAEYEYTCKDSNGDYCPYRKYELGMEIYSYCEYRKVEKWCVIGNEECGYALTNKKCSNYKQFIGTKEECEQWVKDHTIKNWLDERKSCLSISSSKEVINGYSAGVTEVCKKILEEFENKLPFYIDTGRNYLLKDIKSIIKDLGVEV